MIAADKQKCMVPDCNEPARWKGICQKCYGQAKNLIDNGKTTWDELAEMGLCEVKSKKLLMAFIKKKGITFDQAIEPKPLTVTGGSSDNENYGDGYSQ